MLTVAQQLLGVVVGYGIYSYVQHNRKKKIKAVVDEMVGPGIQNKMIHFCM